ncbi:MAG TPA: dihydrolipoyl dehydrogenase [Dehalococcoidia bacterium]|nr:dihydrolipoyl dehydrogenase [Dehalococcoidia bacterium]
MAESEAYDVAVVGAGPGGYVAAIRAAQLGLRVALIEREALGGVCLNHGCIPSKTLLHAAELVAAVRDDGERLGIAFDGLHLDLGRAADASQEVAAGLCDGVALLLRQHGVEVIEGSAQLTSATALRVEPDGRTIEAANVILATGARATAPPGINVDGERVITSREALLLREPPDPVVIVGGGAVGVEFAYLWSAYGARVTVVEALPQLLPGEDEEAAAALERSFNRRGIEVRTSTPVAGVAASDDGATVTLDSGEELAAQRVLVAAGVAPNSEGLGLEQLGVALDRGFVQIDGHCRSNVAGLWAIGDLTGELALAHVASAQGVTAVEAIAGLDPASLDYDWMPRAVYCQPQVASVGLTAALASERGHEVSVGRFPYGASGRAVAVDGGEGFVKLVIDTQTQELLGAQIVGHGATELIAQASLARLLETTPAELAATVHPHPTLSEAIKEAALAVGGEAIHFYAPRGSTANG